MPRLHAPSTLLSLLPLLLLLTTPALSASKPSNAILLSDVQSLTLRGSGAQTAHRRLPSVPQLRCVSSPAICKLHEIDVMRCTNQGSAYDAEDVQWSCAASLPPELKLGSTDVACEGYSRPDDAYVLKGSCGVEYRLVLTEHGEQKFPELANGGGGGGGGWWGSGSSSSGDAGKDEEKSGPAAILFGIIFALVCCWIVYSACIAANDNRRPGAARRPGNNNWFGGGGGGGGGGFNPGFGPGGGGGGWDDPPPPYSKSTTAQSQGWRPGFWSGMAGGAAAGYAAAASRGNNRQETHSSGSGWGAGPSSSPSFSRSNSQSTSSARYESTGFGSTSRR
ncbi:uncharacterized protein GGS25DRAFT_476127 [Hypoxylon fragiforme]|uniref:uncharacterized protein n=1 Tax=Hypoxylon fragiforme TaxID=63214 RepID=UPI0020C6614B|nr:uncharacterized protein GGS25DRAFT_476127 [Hypoxylon fragiforme]KAI2612607.1 hypothetical protein GGS25DRAFT_476127 [Hypoxylon fragiforme]